jgi:hypothetical protein
MQTYGVLSHFNRHIKNSQQELYDPSLLYLKVSQLVCEVVHISVIYDLQACAVIDVILIPIIVIVGEAKM